MSAGKVQLTFQVDRETADRLGAIAERDGRSIAELVRAAVWTLLGRPLPPGVRITDDGPRYSADWLNDGGRPA